MQLTLLRDVRIFRTRSLFYDFIVRYNVQCSIPELFKCSTYSLVKL